MEKKKIVTFRPNICWSKLVSQWEYQIQSSTLQIWAKNIIGIKNFELYSLAIKNAFLQEEIKCEVFIKQPEQYAIPGTLWRLKKSVYGMVEAVRKWWDKISGKLTEKNCQLSRLDPWLIVILVDDLKIAVSRVVWTNNKRYWKVVWNRLCGKNQFVYTGLKLMKTTDGITTDQVKYIFEPWCQRLLA